MKMTRPTSKKDVQRDWYLLDAKSQILGRLATSAATLLMGKNKPYFVRNLDCGNHVVIVNASEIKLSGNKQNNKQYFRHSGYPGGFRSVSYVRMKKNNPEQIVRKAVGGMLPDNKLKDLWLKRLHIYQSNDHDHQVKFRETV